jgi:hypothetical protein
MNMKAAELDERFDSGESIIKIWLAEWLEKAVRD